MKHSFSKVLEDISTTKDMEIRHNMLDKQKLTIKSLLKEIKGLLMIKVLLE